MIGDTHFMTLTSVKYTWWHHDMDTTFPAFMSEIPRSPVHSPQKGPVMWRFDCLTVVSFGKLLKQWSSFWCFEPYQSSCEATLTKDLFILGGLCYPSLPLKEPHYQHESLQWRHNGRDGVPNHRCVDCLLKVQIKKNIKAPRHWPLWGEFTGDRCK